LIGAFGGFLGWLFYFGEDWLKAQMPVLFPADSDSLLRAAWCAHLGHDQASLRGLMAELHDCYEEDIALLASDHADSEES
jgi:hypothetical protein